eukprot:3919199-Prymnesium_polylepis.1
MWLTLRAMRQTVAHLVPDPWSGRGAPCPGRLRGHNVYRMNRTRRARSFAILFHCCYPRKTLVQRSSCKV